MRGSANDGRLATQSIVAHPVHDAAFLAKAEPLIAYQVERDLRNAGARVITAGYLDAASYMTQHPDLSGAVVDFQLGDETAVSLCRRLFERDLPFVIHTGYAADAIRREWPLVPIIQKPASSDEIPTALSDLLGSREKTLQGAAIGLVAP